MHDFPLLDQLQSLPAAHDPARVALVKEGLAAAGRQDALLAAFVAAIERHRAGAGLVAALAGNSPYLGQIVLRDPGFLAVLARDGIEATVAGLLDGLDRRRDDDSRGRLMAELRRVKARLALAVAIADIAGLWPLERVTGSLSLLSQRALHRTAGFLLAEAEAAGHIALPDTADPCRGSGYAILAMGKLGADELNYSSDIDLVVFFDQDVIDYSGPRAPVDFYSRLTQGLVRILNDRTGDGYVFRTDLRLRPDPGVTPLAISMEAAEGYYGSLGQNWERAAMIKARAIAGDVVAGAGFLNRIGPFVWRKYLDFAAIKDIHSIKRQIHTHRGHAAVAVAGHNIKLGRGGIREIEFFAQTQQLIAGGREPGLRHRGTCEAVRALAAAGRVEPETAQTLIEAYRFLRRVEHRLQMIGDAQTQTLPKDRPGLSHLATFLGYDQVVRFEREMLAVLDRVQGIYGRLFETAAPLDAEAGSLVFTGTDDDPDTLATLAGFGFSSPESVAAEIRSWHHGRYRATRSTRSRELLTELMPSLLKTIGATAEPDRALARFDAFLAKLPAGIQLFSLFQANPHLLRFLMRVLGTAPRLADLLSRRPSLLDNLLDAAFLEPAEPVGHLRPDLNQALDHARDYQDVLEIVRRWANDRRFLIGLRALETETGPFESGPALSDVADVAIQALVPRVTDQFAEVHGRVPDGGMAILALGKLGGREMTFESDLDLIFVYDSGDPAAPSDGAKPLAQASYFGRLSQRIIGAITAMTGEGRLYEVDMRLRPSGHAGPVAVPLAGFAKYQREDAWVWEHMALTRARFVHGPADLGAAIQTIIRQVLTRPRDSAAVLAAAADMRRKIAAEHPTRDPWRVKHVRGGLIDVEFVAQALELCHAAARPEVLSGNTADALDRLGAAGCLAPAVAAELAQAARRLGAVQGLLRLCVAPSADKARLPDDFRAVLTRVLGGDPATTLRTLEAAVHGHTRQIIEHPATDRAP